MPSPLVQSIEMISREKHIEPAVIIAAIEDAMIVAARKFYKTEEELRSKFNPESGQVEVYAVHVVVGEVADPLKEISLSDAQAGNPGIELGQEIRRALPTDVLGRIAAQTAKQVILQKVREAERDIVFSEYHTRVGELINCIVKRIEGPDVIVDIGRTEGRLSKRDQSRLETYNMGDRLRVVIKVVERAAKGPQVIVSRADPALVQRLFEMEVPEIYDGTVQIRAVAREAGERTKIAVESRDKDVDPVGACVGMKGMRVQSIIRELRGEKIDIIPFNEDTVLFAQKALSPAKVTRVQIVEPEEKRLEVIVEDTQLSLAIGKKGQNVRLASKLIGWNIDIKSEEEKRREIEAQMAELTAPGTPLSELAAVGPKTIEKLEAHGVVSIERLADMTPEQLIEIPGIGDKMVEKIRVSVAAYFEALDAQQAALDSAEAAPESEPQAAAESESADSASEASPRADVLEAEPASESETAESAGKLSPEPPPETQTADTAGTDEHASPRLQLNTSAQDASVHTAASKEATQPEPVVPSPQSTAPDHSHVSSDSAPASPAGPVEGEEQN